MSAGTPLFLVTAHYGSSHGDTSATYCVTRDLADAILAARSAEELGYQLDSIDHGVSITVLDEGRTYRKDEWKSNDGVPVPPDHPWVLTFRKRSGAWSAEWREEAEQRFGLTKLLER